MDTKIAKKYSPKDFETNVYNNWEELGFFKPVDGKTKESFFIPMPPPNVTSQLHVGHSLMLTLEDIMTRYHRMKGDRTLLLPGTDHAGISTQVKVEEKLAKEGKTKHDMSRDDFFNECEKWTDKYSGIIQGQFKRMGTSCDWSKEKFTLDDDMNENVTKAFVDLYNKGLIYKGEYMVNYDPLLDTVISDQEVIYKKENTKLYHINYFVSGSDKQVCVATTRPETMLGDVAVAVHPKDKRYKKLLKAGKKLILPIINKEIPIIADEKVDIDFGTGAVKITPAHDANDFEMGKRHDLPLDNVVISKEGTMTDIAGIFSGQDCMTARLNIVELLKTKGNLIKEENYISKVAYGERSHKKIETIISSQWFVKVEPIVKKVVKGYRSKDFEIIPNRFNKTFEDWIFNLNDWCISRQLIWGHRIPIWYGPDNEKFCAQTLEDAQKVADAHYGKKVELVQDNDVLDTWFSSALWPFSILGKQIGSDKDPKDYQDFYPSSVLETGHDIIFFWVIRMLLFGYEFTGQTPFKKIYFHGLVKDSMGRKMSKSLGNGIDPLDMIEKHGTDALRMTLVIGNTPGNDLKFDEENVKNNSFFINKLWNASRFVGFNLDNIDTDISKIEKNLSKNYSNLEFHEKWILSRISHLYEIITNGLETFNFSEAGQELYVFTKNEFCDYYIEEYKITKETSKYGHQVLTFVINKLLTLWHPYIPFVTEELYTSLGFNGNLIVSDWGKMLIKRDMEVEKLNSLMIDVIKNIRSIRADNNILPHKTIKLQIYAINDNAIFLNSVINIISGLVKSEETKIVDQKPTDKNLAFSIVKKGVELYIDTSNAIDVEIEQTRLKKNISSTRDYIILLDKKLLNESFVNNAPEKLVRLEMQKKEQAKNKLLKLQEKLDTLK